MEIPVSEKLGLESGTRVAFIGSGLSRSLRAGAKLRVENRLIPSLARVLAVVEI